MMAALIAGPQLRPVFMWCCTLDIGAHHACWLLLQALFITAIVPTVTEHNGDIALRSAAMFSVPLFHWFAVLRIEGCQTRLLGDINNRQACRSMRGTNFSLTANHVFAGKFTRQR